MTEVKDALGRAVSRRSFLGTTALAAASVGGIGALSGCGGGSSGGPGGGSGEQGDAASGTGGAVTWGNWANPGEATRFREVSKAYESEYKTTITYQIVTGDYNPKLLTQLSGGSAPDAFYVNTEGMAKLIESKSIIDLTDFTSQSDSPVKVDDFYPGLLPWCKPASGEGIYGLPVDCNPLVFWFNEDMIAEAGISESPVQQFEAGTWNRDALQDFLVKMKPTGKRGMVIAGEWAYWLSWMTTFGGTTFADNKAVFNEDPKSMDTLNWLFDNMKSDLISYGGSLPKGQGIDALFYAQQLSSCQMGRWILPNLKKLKFPYDMAPFPSEDGKTIAPVNIPVAAMGVNAKAKDPQAALWWATRYVSVDAPNGQKARLSGGGNAVPSIPGAEDIVTEGGLPKHAAYFNDVAKVGYAIPPEIASKAAVAANINIVIDKSIKSGADAQTFANTVCNFINKG